VIVRLSTLAALAAAAAVSAALALGPTPPPAAAQSSFVTLRHAPSGLTLSAPRGTRLTVSRGVYVLRRGSTRFTFSRTVTTVTPRQFGEALVGQLGGRVRSRSASARRFTVVLDRGAAPARSRDRRRGGVVEVTTSTSPRRRPASLATVRRIAGSARGGFRLTAPQAPTRIPLTEYRAPDGGATGLVPSDPRWTIQSSGGSIEGSSERGAFLFGFSVNVLLPESLPFGTSATAVPSGLVAPYLGAGDAMAFVLTRLAPAISDVRVRQVLREGVLGGFTSSAFVLYDYRVNGAPWTGGALVASDGPQNYSNFLWNFYYSGIGVPSGSDPAVGAALLEAWRSWNPSGAIAQRASRARELIAETNAVWQEVSEFRSRTADRQARDVGCLLLGYYVIEDNSRRFDLPPLPCGQRYVP
jgi:hypothetical protein